MIQLNWSGSGNTPRAEVLTRRLPCRYCGRNAYLREPDTNEPAHKVCAEAALTHRATDIATRLAA